jgi:hypothetical protein
MRDPKWPSPIKVQWQETTMPLHERAGSAVRADSAALRTGARRSRRGARTDRHEACSLAELDRDHALADIGVAGAVEKAVALTGRVCRNRLPRRMTGRKGIVIKRSLVLLLVLAVAAMSVGASTAATNPPRAVVAQAKAEWLTELKASSRNGDRSTRFPSPPRAVLIRHLQTAEKLHGFRIVSLEILHPVQAAPVVVIRSDDKLSIARAAPKIINLFDPYQPTAANPSGYAYEAYFFVAQTSSGVPYLATFNFWRGPHHGGGEWAASENLYPFPHG